MPSLILFCKSPNPDPYINVMAYATTGVGLTVDSIIFVWYEMPQRAAEDLQEAISQKVRDLANRDANAYERTRQLLGGGPRSDHPINRTQLNEFVERYNYGSNYFDLTGLPKDDLILVSSVLLANGVKNVRMFHSITLPPKLVHEYPEHAVGTAYRWLNLYEIADEFMGFFDRREGRRLLTALCISFVVSFVSSAWLWTGSAIKATDLPLYFFSILGSVFSVALPMLYWSSSKRNLLNRLKRLRFGSASH